MNINVYHNFNIIAARWKEVNCSSTAGWVKTLHTFIQGTTMKHMKKDKYSGINEVQCMQVRKQQLELDIEQQTGSKQEKEYVKAVYCHPAYLTYMQSTLCEMPGWMKHKLESRCWKVYQ